jgi:peptide/nickel transport system substrate-binding protein
MTARSRSLLVLGLAALLVVLGLATPLTAQAPRRGGILSAMLIENPPGFSIHESATIASVWPVAPCFSNLVIFDPLKQVDTAETVIPELAEKWSWQDNYRNLVFFLRRDVKWHDGKPFTSRDVKYTFDVVRGAPDAPAKLRLNPRKDWYANVEAIEAPEAHTVVFRLKRPQPSLLLMLASGYSPVYPAHVSLNDLRQRCVGTGPFKLKQYLPGSVVEMERNPDYFVPGRPYLDGIRYTIITERGTRMAALQTGRLDVSQPLEMTRTMADTLKKAAPSLVVRVIGQNGSDNVVLNHKRAPFENPAVRRAVNFALDRRAYVKGVRHDGAVVGAAPHVTAARQLGPAREGSADPARVPGPGARQGRGAPPARPGRLRSRQAPAGGSDHAEHRHLRRPRLVRGRSAPAGRHRGGRQAGRVGAVLPRAGAPGLPDRRQPHRLGHRRS